MNVTYSNSAFQYTMKTGAGKNAIIGMPKWQQTICNAAYCGKFMFTCQSHTIRNTKPTFIIPDWILQANEMTTKKMPDTYYCTMTEEIKTLLALGSAFNAFTVTLSENGHDRLSNSVSTYLATCAWLLRIPWLRVTTADILFFFITCILTYIQLWYSCCTIFTNHAVA